MLALALVAITFHADFEGGSLGKVERAGPAHFRCAVTGQADQEGRNRQANWYYFRIDGAKGVPLTIDLVNLVGEYNYRPGTHAVTRGTRPVYSHDQRAWTRIGDDQVAWDEKEVRLTLRFTPSADRAWIAHVPPYVNADLARLLDHVKASGHATVTSAGRTVKGREIPLVTVGKGPKTVWLMFRQHAWEADTSWVGEGALRFLVSADAARVRERFLFKIFPMAGPDGAASGGVRFNANGYDLNRNWDLVDARLMPEIAAQRGAVLAWVDAGNPIDLFMSFHNTEHHEYLAAVLSAGSAEFRTKAQRLAAALEARTTFRPTRALVDSGLSTTPGKPGRMEVCQGLYHDRRIPCVLMEQMIEKHPATGRSPDTRDRLDFGAALITAIEAALQ